MAVNPAAMRSRRYPDPLGGEDLPTTPITADGDLRRPRSLDITTQPANVLPRNPDRIEAFIFNAGGSLELPIDLGSGDRIGTTLPLTVIVDSGSIAVPQWAPSTYKTLSLLVDKQLTWGGGGGQAKAQLIVGRNAWSPQSGAATATGGAFNNFLKGAAANLGGAAANSLAIGLWPFSPADIADLQWQWPYIGLELQFPAALTAGAARLLLTMPGGPPVLLGLDLETMSANPGDRANSFMILPSAAPFRITSKRAIYAMTPAGIADLRVWEAVRSHDEPALPDLTR